MRIFNILSLILITVLTSCATASFSNLGVGRIKQYTVHNPQIPKEFNGFRILFASDFHFESRFTAQRLSSLIHTLNSLQADVLLLGGDYKGRNGGNMNLLFEALSHVKTTYGTFAIMGNHEKDLAYKEVRKAMQHTGVKLLEHKVDTIRKGAEYILLCGIRNPFNIKENGVSPTLQLAPKDFVIMLTHTPDYAEDVDIRNTDLVLAGHTHGGQVSIFQKWSPAHFSKYGNRFLSGWKYNSQHIPIIISNGIGTSRKDIRLFTPSEVVLITLQR